MGLRRLRCRGFSEDFGIQHGLTCRWMSFDAMMLASKNVQKMQGGCKVESQPLHKAHVRAISECLLPQLQSEDDAISLCHDAYVLCGSP